MPMHGAERFKLLLGLMLCLLAGAGTARSIAQQQPTDLQIVELQAGLLGYARPGAWAPMRVNLVSQASQPRQVLCEWIVSDADGDPAHYSRSVTLNPYRNQPTWLYAALPMNIKLQPTPTWRLRVIDVETHEVRLSVMVSPNQMIERNTGVVGITGTPDLGLGRYAEPYTQHEPIHFLRGLKPAELPDRWQGFHQMQALIWTSAGGDPGDPSISPTVHRAIREWVRRGGHLVISLSSVAEGWSTSPLADLLPPVKIHTVHQVEFPDYVWLGSPSFERQASADRLTVHTFEPLSPRVSVLLRERVGRGRPVVVAGQYGMGRVTLIGADLASANLSRMNLPSDRTLWHAVFGWQSPYYLQRYIDAEVQTGNMVPLHAIRTADISDPIAFSVNQEATVGGAVLLAILFFGLYWLVAGPISFGFLKARNAHQHSWLAFVGCVLVFSAVAWGAAALMRPRTENVTHFSVLDIDMGQQLARTRSWASLFVPRHGQVGVALGQIDSTAEFEGRTHLLSASYAPVSEDEAQYLNPQHYQVNTVLPSQIQLPMRSTTKPIELQYMDSLEALSTATNQDWALRVTDLQVSRGRVDGQATHHLPAPLQDVRLLVCPGDGITPTIQYLTRSWAPGQQLGLFTPQPALPLVQPGDYRAKDRNYLIEGYLGFLQARRYGLRISSDRFDAWRDDKSHAFDLLSFHSLLPPPRFRTETFDLVSTHLQRSLGREIDLSPMLAFRGLVVIGVLDDAPLPAPFLVEGERLPASGKALVRWLLPLDAQGTQAPSESLPDALDDNPRDPIPGQADPEG